MKKVIIVTTIIILLVIALSLEVYAAQGYSVELAGGTSVKQGEEITLTLRLKDLVDIGGTAGGVTALTADVEYDTNKLEKVSGQGLNGFSATWGNKIVVDSAEGINENTEVATIKFKAKGNAEVGSTTVTVGDILGTNGSENIAATNVTKTITIAANSNNNGNNNDDDDNTNNSGNSNNNGNSGNTPSGSINVGSESPKKLPKTGVEKYIVFPSMGLVIVIGIISFVKYRAFKGF